MKYYKKLFPPKKRGKGLDSKTALILHENKNKESVWYDDPNEFCDRLKKILASKEAGHTGHINEIISIIEELRELGLLKGDVDLIN